MGNDRHRTPPRSTCNGVSSRIAEGARACRVPCMRSVGGDTPRARSAHGVPGRAFIDAPCMSGALPGTDRLGATPCAKTPPLARRPTTTTRLRARGLQGGPQPPLRSRPRTKGIRIQGHPRSIRVLESHRAVEHARARTHERVNAPDDAPERSAVHDRAFGARERRGAEAPPCNPPSRMEDPEIALTRNNAITDASRGRADVAGGPQRATQNPMREDTTTRAPADHHNPPARKGVAGGASAPPALAPPDEGHQDPGTSEVNPSSRKSSSGRARARPHA